MQEFDGWLWWILAAGLAFAELVNPGVYLIWLALAAALVGALDLLVDWSWEWQLAAFALAAVLVVLAARRLPYGSGAGRMFRSPDSRFLNQRNLACIGREFALDEPIKAGRGKVRIDDSFWLVACARDLPAGARVRVVGAEGAVLQIRETDGKGEG